MEQVSPFIIITDMEENQPASRQDLNLMDVPGSQFVEIKQLDLSQFNF